MVVYADLVFLLNFLVDFLLLLGTNRLSGFPPGYLRCLCAAGLGGVYGSACLFPELSFLGNHLWRTVSFLLIGLTAFGWNKSAIARSSVYILLCTALGGIAYGMHSISAPMLLIAAALLCFWCSFGFRWGIGRQKYIPVTLRWQDREVTVIALRDTGNTLTDPLSGEQVLVAGADIGMDLLGVSQAHLRNPIEALSTGRIPGARLIPYHAVGQPGSMMLAVRFHNVKVGGRTIDPLVAFAPQILAKGQIYQMLTGGALL